MPQRNNAPNGPNGPNGPRAPQTPQRILVCRIDNLGDVVMVFPALRWLKLHYPALQIEMVVRDYARALTQRCPWVDHVWSPEEVTQAVATQAPAPDAVFHLQSTRALLRDCKRWRIPLRVGNLLRSAHWRGCNRWVVFSKRRMREHESHLAWRFFAATFASTSVPAPAAQAWQDFLRQGDWLVNVSNDATDSHTQNRSDNSIHFAANSHAGHASHQTASTDPPVHRPLKVLLHPGSNGNGRQWPLQHFAALASALHAKGHHVSVTGAAAERPALAPLLQQLPAGVTDLVGGPSLTELIHLIAQADCLVASGTGPLHIAGASGTHALGLFPPLTPIGAFRWRPIGPRVTTLQSLPDGACQKSCSNLSCACMAAVTVEQVLATVLSGPQQANNGPAAPR